MKKRTVTIVDVARRAGVSVGTASQALNSPDLVGQERLARVNKAVAELGYTRNLLAQGLRAKQSPAIGLCGPHSRAGLFPALVYRFEQLAAANRRQILHVLSQEGSDRELQQVKTLVAYGVAGVLLIPTARPQPALDFLAARNVPTVIVDRPLSGDARFDQVTVDNRSLMTELILRLVALGHRRFLFIPRSRHATATIHRLEGLRAARRKAGVPTEARVVESADDQAAFGQRFAQAMEEFQPTAIIASNDVIAAWTVHALDALKVRCPRDVSLIVFDEPAWAEIVRPPLSCVRLAVDEMTETAWSLLLARIHDSSLEPRAVVVGAEILFRDSVGPPPDEAAPRVRSRTESA